MKSSEKKSRNVRAFCEERAADKLEILKQSEGTASATNLCVVDIRLFLILKPNVRYSGIDRAVFLDKREFHIPIYTQIEEAVDFVLRNIRLGATIDGLVRKEKYELLPEAIREMIVTPIVTVTCWMNLYSGRSL